MWASWEGQIIGALNLTHNDVLSEEAWRAVIGISAGDRYQADSIREAVQRLYQTGKIASVEVHATPAADGTLALTFLLEERGRVTALALSGHRKYAAKEIKAILGFVPEKPFDPSEWGERVEHLIAAYKQEGYMDIAVESRFERILMDRSQMEVFLTIHEGERVRIRHLVLSGERSFSDKVLYGLIGSKASEYFSQKQLDNDIARLRAFYRKEGYRMARVGPPQMDFIPNRREMEIVLPIVASTRIVLVYHGFGLFASKKMDPFILMNAQRGDTLDVLEESAQAMERHYRDRGYPFAAVSVEVKPFPDKNAKEVHFTLTGQTRAKIRSILFDGIKAFPEKRLRPLVSLREEGLFTTTSFTRAALDDDAKNLALFYKQNGFQEVQVTPDIRFDENQEWGVVTFRVDEGMPTQIGTVQVEGTYPFSASEMLDVIGLREGDPFNKGVVREGAGRILTALSRQGYIDAKVDSDIQRTSHRADIRYQILSGKPVYFGEVHLVGNEKSRNVTLLREMRIKPGDPYDDEKILQSQQRLYQTGLFSSVRFDPIRHPDNPAIQDMQLTVVERPPRVIEFGPGYGEREGVRGFLEVGHRNLWGSGRQISARASGSHREWRYSLNYKEPRVLPYDVESILSGTSFFIPRRYFDEATRAGTLEFERQFSPIWKSTIRYQYEDKEISNVKPDAQLTDQDIGRVIIGSLNYVITRDTRDDPFQPRKGSVLGITVRNAAQSLGSKVQMVKVVQQGSFFFSPTSRVTLALSERFGIAKRFGETTLIPLSERFFLGGQSTVRGYKYQTLGEVGDTIIHGQPTGGNVMLIFNEEARVSMTGSLGIVFFFDHGNVWQDEKKRSRLKSTTGIGFRYNTPVGPLRVDWGYKLNREIGEPPNDYHVTLGHAF